MNILVIGNGFDLAHGLPTTYLDFLKFIKALKELYSNKKLNIEEQKISKDVKEFLSKYEDKIIDKKDIWNRFDELLQENVWIGYFLDKLDGSLDENKGWIDFESEIAQVIKAIDYKIEYIKFEQKSNWNNTFSQDNIKQELVKKFLYTYYYLHRNLGDFAVKFVEIDHYRENARILGETPEKLKENIENFIENIYNDLNKLICCLEIYLGKVVGENCHVREKVLQVDELNIDKVLSFNYSHTYEKYYEGNKRIDYDYIHGEISVNRKIENNNKIVNYDETSVNRDIEYNNMVLGIDEYLNDDEKNEKLEFISFKKYFQRIYKKTGCKYKKWVEDLNRSEEHHNIYIFGHSLDVTDKEVLRELILLENVTVTIFYHNKKAYMQQIKNLIRIIGQDELIHRVYGKNPKIIFKEIKN